MKKPNVILVLTDDQGYSDLACTGNPWIQTPHIDHFYGEAVRLTDFHVSPLCTPTRGALMTGRRPIRNGAWATCWGRSILRKSEVTMANVFADSGYKTGMFGKWHLGDNYPYRPQDRGFQHVVAHRGGGVGQTPDFWGNNYFDDSYWHNGRLMAHKGYCTDIWFQEAAKFIAANQDQPFFAYIATNAPHDPYLVADKYKDLYQGNPDIPEPAFYGMITNIDENFGALDTQLKNLGIADNTILIFMTDNGSSGGARLGDNGLATHGYNAGMRGKKGSYYDGGHRVPFFIRWPHGNLQGGHDLGQMAMHLDLLPTFIDLCGLRHPNGVDFDGASFADYVTGRETTRPERTQILQIRQSTEPPDQWTNAVMTQRWRLVHGQELYDIAADPSQQHNVAAQHPEVVAQLRATHDDWWAEVTPTLDQFCPISLGNDADNPTRLDAMDVMGDVAWHQTMIVHAKRSTGRWSVDVEQPGTYTLSLRRWPEELGLPIDAAVSAEDANSHIYAPGDGACTTMAPVKARIKLFDQEWTQAVEPGMEAVTFTVDMRQTGETQLEAWFINESGVACGAYYVYVERMQTCVTSEQESFMGKAVTLSLITNTALAVGTDAAATPRFKIEESLDIAEVPSGFPVGFALLTAAKSQYVAFYDSQHRMTVAWRRLDEETWTYQILPSTVGWDSHNYITMAMDDDGHLHVSGNMHCVPLIYFRTEKPGDPATLTKRSMTDANEMRVTYPKFMRDADGRLLFRYRDGGSGNGNEFYNFYDLKTKRWARLLDQPLTDGQNRMNAYTVGPTRGPQGWFHMHWVWRDTPDCATNHHLSYARTRDLLHWESVFGDTVELPIQWENRSLWVDPIPSGGGIINGGHRLFLDNQHRPVITYHKSDANGNMQIYAARPEGSQWKVHLLTDWNQPIAFSGRGAMDFIGIRIGDMSRVEPGVLAMTYRHRDYGNGQLLLDEQSLRPLDRTIPIPRAYPTELERVHSDFSGMQIMRAGDLGNSGDEHVRFMLQWETLGANRDRPREPPLPEPSMLRLYNLSQVANEIAKKQVEPLQVRSGK